MPPAAAELAPSDVRPAFRYSGNFAIFSKISKSRLIEDRTKLNEESFTAFTLKAFTGFRSGLFSRRTVFATD